MNFTHPIASTTVLMPGAMTGKARRKHHARPARSVGKGGQTKRGSTQSLRADTDLISQFKYDKHGNRYGDRPPSQENAFALVLHSWGLLPSDVIGVAVVSSTTRDYKPILTARTYCEWIKRSYDPKSMNQFFTPYYKKVGGPLKGFLKTRLTSAGVGDVDHRADALVNEILMYVFERQGKILEHLTKLDELTENLRLDAKGERFGLGVNNWCVMVRGWKMELQGFCVRICVESTENECEDRAIDINLRCASLQEEGGSLFPDKARNIKLLLSALRIPLYPLFRKIADTKVKDYGRQLSQWKSVKNILSVQVMSGEQISQTREASSEDSEDPGYFREAIHLEDSYDLDERNEEQQDEANDQQPQECDANAEDRLFTEHHETSNEQEQADASTKPIIDDSPSHSEKTDPVKENAKIRRIVQDASWVIPPPLEVEDQEEHEQEIQEFKHRVLQHILNEQRQSRTPKDQSIIEECYTILKYQMESVFKGNPLPTDDEIMKHTGLTRDKVRQRRERINFLLAFLTLEALDALVTDLLARLLEWPWQPERRKENIKYEISAIRTRIGQLGSSEELRLKFGWTLEGVMRKVYPEAWLRAAKGLYSSLFPPPKKQHPVSEEQHPASKEKEIKLLFPDNCFLTESQLIDSQFFPAIETTALDALVKSLLVSLFEWSLLQKGQEKQREQAKSDIMDKRIIINKLLLWEGLHLKLGESIIDIVRRVYPSARWQVVNKLLLWEGLHLKLWESIRDFERRGNPSARGQTNTIHDVSLFPEKCPWTEAQLLDMRFLPEQMELSWLQNFWSRIRGIRGRN